VTGTSALPPELATALAAAVARLHPVATRIVHLAETGSTNDVAATLAVEGAAEGTVVVADAQTRGRGRSGHTWFSPPGAGLYVSVVFRPAEAVYTTAAAPPPWAGLLTLAAGVALADGIKTATGLALDIKWPNDLVAADGTGPRAANRRWRKIAGILAEGHTVQGVLRHVVIGYGINLSPASYPADIAALASSLETELGRPVDRAAVLVETLAALRQEYEALRRGESAALVERWRLHSPSSSGAHVSWIDGGEERAGVTSGIDEAGALLVGSGDRVIALRAGEVTWR
jgi:BirA family biotin operon repressor/biotin-[acetyl-CoA-carboxylase] ligase